MSLTGTEVVQGTIAYSASVSLVSKCVTIMEAIPYYVSGGCLAERMYHIQGIITLTANV